MSDLGDRLAHVLHDTDEEAFKRLFIGRYGSAPHRWFKAEDGYLCGWTTGRLYGGEHEGRFAAFVYKPVGPGARTGKAQEWALTYWRPFSQRKKAKARALHLYYQHSPRARGERTAAEAVAEARANGVEGI